MSCWRARRQSGESRRPWRGEQVPGRPRWACGDGVSSARLATNIVEEAMGGVFISHEDDAPGVACALGAKAVR